MLKSVSENKMVHQVSDLTDFILTIDVGNSALKWGCWQKNRLLFTDFSDYDGEELARTLDSVLIECNPPDGIWVACVAGEMIEKQLTAWMQQHWHKAPSYLRTGSECLGVINAYAKPSEHGVDRWAALIGARELYQVPVCVIDVGTAVTVDLMDSDGRHQGGRIMPGLAMMRESLLKQTAGVNKVDGDSAEFAINTADAVTSGTLRMLGAGLNEVSTAAKKVLGNDMKTIITGGSAEQMLSLLDMSEIHLEPDLIMHGLYQAARHSSVELANNRRLAKKSPEDEM